MKTNSEDICPKCGAYKLPFDLVCDSCYSFGVTFGVKYEYVITHSLWLLGYKYQLISSNENFFSLLIKAPYNDEMALKQLLNEEAESRRNNHGKEIQ